MSTAVGVEVFRDFAEMAKAELLVIDEDTTLARFPARGALEPGVLPPGAGPLSEAAMSDDGCRAAGRSPPAAASAADRRMLGRRAEPCRPCRPACRRCSTSPGAPASRTRRSRACSTTSRASPPSTKVRVEQAIAELNYTPSPAARAMAKRRSGSIGLIQAGRPDYGPSNAALGFNEAAHEAGYTVTQASMRSLDADVLRQAVHRLALQRVEAIVLISGEREGVGVLTRHRRGRAARRGRVRGRARACTGCRSTSTRARASRPSTSSGSGTARSATSPVRPTRWMPRSAAAAGRTRCAAHGLEVHAPIVGRLARGIR